MLETIDCVYRVHERGELISSQFKIATGKIVGIEDFLTLDVAMYDYTVDNYSYYSELGTTVLYNLLCKNPTALAAINYNNIGAIVVYRDRHSLYLKAPNQFIKHTAFLKEQFKFDFDIAGVCKTELLTLQTTQNLFYVIVDKSNKDKKIIHTRAGKKEVQFEYDAVAKPSLAKYLELCNDEDAYATVHQNNELVKVYVEGDVIRE